MSERATIRWRGSKAELMQLLRRLPGILSGRERDHFGIGRAFRLQVAVSVLGSIHQAYLVKSAGGQDELGNSWKPLKRETIAGRAPPPHKRRGERPRGLLTDQQDRVWGGIFAKLVSRGLAKDEAAQRAWAIVKALGGKTRLGTLGSRKVPILVVSRRLVRSLAPGRLFTGPTSYHVVPQEQVFEIDRPGEIVLGSRVPYAARQHSQRPLWPRQIGPWLGRAGQKGLDVIVTLLEWVAR